MKLRIGLAQINSIVGGFEHNFDKIKSSIVQAQKFHCDIIAFPELTITGYPPEDLLFRSMFVQENLKYLEKIKKLCAKIICIIGFVDKKNDKLYNAAAVIWDRQLLDVYHKTNLSNYGVFDEKRYFTPGEKVSVYDIQGIRFGLGICEDLWVGNSFIDTIAEEANSSFMIFINASPYYIHRWKDRLKLLKDKAKRSGNYIFYVNLVGGQDELVFDGHSLVVNPEAKLINAGKQFEEDFIISDIEIPEKSQNIFVQRINLVNIKNFKPSTNEKKRLAHRKIKISDFFPIEEEIYNALVLGTRDYVCKNNFSKVVIGLSGGIDSALTVAIAKDALGEDNVTALFMPSRFSSNESFNDANTLSQNLGIKFKTVPIQGIFEKYLETLEVYFKGLPFDTTEENLQARIRGNILMAFSNKFKALVLTTGNKSEMSTGYATLYGDMAGGFAVIKDVPKSMVYKLALYRNKRAGYDLIPVNILKKAPSAELREGQKDTDTLPDYTLLDKILYYYIEKYLSYNEIVKKGFNKEIVKRVISMVDKSEYKRRQAPPGIKITKTAFGKDRRFPITNGYIVST